MDAVGVNVAEIVNVNNGQVQRGSKVGNCFY